MGIENVHPPGWAEPKGYSNGVVVDGAARLVFVAGQVAWDAEQRLVGAGDFALQFGRAFENVVAVVAAAGGQASDLVQMTVFVTDKQSYLAARKELGAHWRRIAGKHYPAMALVEVAGLVEPGALVEIQATAAIAVGSRG